MKYMSDAVSEKGYAKINLHLDVLGKEENGYHRVETVMQSISLFDVVKVRLIEGESFAVCDIVGVPKDRKNIAVKAAELFLSEIGSELGAKITIEKNIPMAAGMAGGSADAAATLKALNKLFGDRFNTNELCFMASKLGADVPFCVKGGVCFADGRGDILHPFPKMPHCYIVAACGGEGVSTPWAYRTLDDKYNDFLSVTEYTPKGTEKLKKVMESFNQDISAVAKEMYNIFEHPILELRPIANGIKKELLDCGAVGAMMSGSGPSVFGIFQSKENAECAAEIIRGQGHFAVCAEPFYGA